MVQARFLWQVQSFFFALGQLSRSPTSAAADVSIDIKRDAALRLKEAGKKAEGLQASL